MEKKIGKHLFGGGERQEKPNRRKKYKLLNLITESVVILIILACGYYSYFLVEIRLFKERYVQ